MLLSQDQKWTKTSWFPWKCVQLLPLTWSSSGFECAQKGAMVHLIFPSGSISMSHQERTTWAWPDTSGSNCLLWQAAELLTCLLKSTLWKNIRELRQIFKLTQSIFKLLWWPHLQWDLFAMDSWCQNEHKNDCQRPNSTKCLQAPWPWVAPWYLNIGSTSLRMVKSEGDTWFSWMSQTEGAPGHLSSSKGGMMTCSPRLVWTWMGNSLFHDHILLDSTSCA